MSRVKAVGTVRRLQALQVEGWRLSDLAMILGWDSPQRVSYYLNLSPDSSIDCSVHEQVVTLFRRCDGMIPGSSVRDSALREGWVGMDCWDGVDMDAPGSVPLVSDFEGMVVV